jgi:hypothetical protein
MCFKHNQACELCQAKHNYNKINDMGVPSSLKINYL